MPVNIAILSVSDTRSMANDKSGDLLQELILQSGHNVVKRLIVSDEMAEIVKVLQKWIDMETIDVILSTGGTGLTGRDVTVEAHRKVYEKEIDAFSSVFTTVCFSIIY